MYENPTPPGPYPFRGLTSSAPEIGSDEANHTYFCILANSAGGIFSAEWVPWTQIFAVCHLKNPLTSMQLRALFRGKSVNTAGFLMAALKDAGLIARKEGRVRHYQLTQKALRGDIQPTEGIPMIIRDLSKAGARLEEAVEHVATVRPEDDRKRLYRDGLR